MGRSVAHKAARFGATGAALLVLLVTSGSLSACNSGGSAADPVVSTSSTHPDAEPTTTTRGASDDSSPLGGINGSVLEHDLGPAVVMVLARPCDGLGYGQGTGFAIDPRTIVTNWHVVAEDNEDPNSPIDPHPWIMTYQRGWRRGTVIGATSSPDVAVVRLDEDASELDRSVQWAERGPDAGQNLAILGFPGIEGGEFNLVVGTADAVDETTEGVPSFEVVRALSGRTGPGNSGGPIVDASGDVVGVHTWGTFDRSHWFGQDGDTVRSTVNDIVARPRKVATGCPADGPERTPLSYVVRLGTFARTSDAEKRWDVLRDGGPDGVVITSVNSTEWVPFLLSDYPEVLMAGPFSTRAAAEDAVRVYQAVIDRAGIKDRFSVGVMPTEVFEQVRVEQGRTSCMPASDNFVVVHGVTDADPLKLRASPTTSASVLAELRSGEELMVGTDDPVTSDGLTWIPVATVTDGKQICGWVAQRYTQPLRKG